MTSWTETTKTASELSDANLRAHYKLNREIPTRTTVTDTKGNNGTLSGYTFNDGTPAGGVTVSDGAMVFDGVDGRVAIDNTITPISLVGSVTVAGWLFLPTGAKTNVSPVISTTIDANNRFTVSLNAGNNLRAGFHDGTSQALFKSGDISYDTWTFFSYTSNGTTSDLKLNTVSQVGTSGVTPSNTAGSRIGSSTGNTSFVQGSVTVITVYNRVLTTDEISQIYSAGKDSYSPISKGLVFQMLGKDFAGTEATPTTFYDTHHLIQGKINESIRFDGADDYVEVPDAGLPASFFQNGFTLSAWIKPDTIGESTGRIMDKTTNTAGATGFNFRLDSSNRLACVISGTSNVFSDTNAIVYGGAWQHVLVTVSADAKANFYINGALSGTANQTTGALSGITTTNALRIGNRSGATDRTFDGGIDDVRIYNRVLTTSEIALIYNGGEGTEDETMTLWTKQAK
jgi:hypothetical protein